MRTTPFILAAALTLSPLFLALSPQSLASTEYGNPATKIVLDSGPSVQIGSVTGFTCPGSEADVVNRTLTASGTVTFTLSEDTFCDLYIQVLWDGESSYEQVQVTGFTDYITDSAESQRTIALDPTNKTATLQ